MTSSSGLTIFCDDIRQEIGGKYSLVGCYGGELIVVSDGNAVLPKLCASINLRIPSDHEFQEITLEITKSNGDQKKELFKTSVRFEDIKSNSPEGRRPEADTTEEKVLDLRMPWIISPLEVTEDCLIKVRAYIDDECLKLGALKILLQSPSSSDQSI